MLLLASFLFLLNKGKSFELIIPDVVDEVGDEPVTRGLQILILYLLSPEMV